MCASVVPGSVIAAKHAPGAGGGSGAESSVPSAAERAPSIAPATRRQKYRNAEIVSTVVPDLVATRCSVFRGSVDSASARMRSGSVVSTTRTRTPSESAPNTAANASPARLEPPMPSSSTSAKRSRAASEKRTILPTSFCIAEGARSHPSRSEIASSSGFQTVWSRSRMRRNRSPARASAMAPPMAMECLP